MVIVDAVAMLPPATATAAPATFQTTAGANLILALPGSNKLNGKVFFLQASGQVSTLAGTYTATIQPILYGDASLATVTTKPLFSATAGTLAYTGTVGAAIPWSMWGRLSGDTASGTLSGSVESWVGATYKIATVIVAPVSTTINFNSEPPFKFAIGLAQVGTVGATPKFILQEFNISQE